MYKNIVSIVTVARCVATSHHLGLYATHYINILWFNRIRYTSNLEYYGSKDVVKIAYHFKVINVERKARINVQKH